MIEILDKKRCMGCSACYSICPTNCIKMIPDSEGFLYPKVDKSKCTNCNLCVKTCPLLNLESIKRERPKVCGGYNKNQEVRFNSSSGGIFYLLASTIIKKGGVVFGASFDNNNNVKHVVIKNVEDLPKLMTSKYVQSEIGKSYKEAKKYLINQKYVLFTGTPCQIAGLYHYLNRNYSNLITQDIICHGVPSPLLWNYYLSNINDKNTDIININFRDKEVGWNNYSFSYIKKDKKFSNVHSKDIYMRSFLSNYNLRPSCYACKFKKGDSGSDLTLGDFWGVSNFNLFKYTKNGISLLIINSKKGIELVKEISDNVILQKVNFEESLAFNRSYFESVKMPKKRDLYFKEVNRNNFIDITKKYTKKSMYFRFKFLLKRALRKIRRKK